jgi:glycosyltransferase involved in cell wall biosynthesis
LNESQQIMLAPRLPNCVVVIPAHNEEEDIGHVVRKVKDLCDYPVVVIDDDSSDETIAEARRAGAVVLPLVSQLGAWGAIQTGLRYAWRYGYDYAITMDADGQHEPESLPVLIRPVLEDEADVAIGACTSRGSRLRKIAWKIMKAVSGLRLEDLTSGFRVYDRRAIRRLAGWQATLLEYQDVGVLAMLQASGIRICDVEVSMLPRRSGISRIFYSWSSVIYYMVYTLMLGATKRGMSHKDPA